MREVGRSRYSELMVPENLVETAHGLEHWKAQLYALGSLCWFSREG